MAPSPEDASDVTPDVHAGLASAADVAAALAASVPAEPETPTPDPVPVAVVSGVAPQAEAPVAPEPDDAPDVAEDEPGFRVSLSNFDGPFDLLLSLISQHELDITEISLSKVTDEFIAYLRDLDDPSELDQASEFLVVAATLLDMKVAGLLPQGELVDAESVALLEARDLLFARLLQYRAFKEVSTWFQQRLESEDRRRARAVRLDEQFRNRVPELIWNVTLDEFAATALLAFSPKAIPTVGLDHLHAPLVSIREQAAIVVTQLRSRESMTFRELVAGAESVGVVVARFVSVLELYRHAAISFEQLEPLGELTLRWTAETWSEETLATLGADYDR